MAPIFTDGLRLEPENRGVTEYPASFGAQLGATAASSLLDSPTAQLSGLAQLEEAKGNDLSRYGAGPDAAAFGFEPEPVVAGPPPLTIGKLEAQERVKAAGLDKDLKVPEQDEIAVPALDLMIRWAKERRERETTINRGPQNIFASGAGLATSFLVGAVDPLNLASAFVPVLGELRYGKLLAGAGESLVRRGAVRAGVGATEGVVGQALLEPLDWYAHTQEGRDFGMADVLHNLVFGAALGAGLHAGGGAAADIYRARKGRALYPFGPGEPLDVRAQADAFADRAYDKMASAVEARDVEAPGLQPVLGLIDDVLSASPALRVLQDLPPRAHEDSMRAAVAAIVDGETVKVGQMLEAAAAHDPRIAESLGLAEQPPAPSPQVRMLADSFLHSNKGDVAAALKEFDDYRASRPDPDSQLAKDVRATIEAGLPGSAPKTPEAPPAASTAPAHIPGAPRARGRAAATGGADGAQSPRNGAGDRRPPEQAFRELSRTKPDFDDPDVIAASKAADAAPAPVATRLDDRVAAAEKAEAFAKQMYDMFRERLPEAERTRVEDYIKALDEEHKVNGEAIERSGACLFGARE